MRMAEGRSGAGCGGKVAHHCVIAGAEGLRNYTHPKQGSAKDCSVIAALSSIQKIDAKRLSGAYPTYNFKSGSVTLTTKKLPVDSTGALVYATSAGGTWPMLWEKAFTKLISAAVCPRPASCPDRQTCNGEPDIATAFAKGYSGLTALKEIGRYNTEVVEVPPYDAQTGNLLWPAVATTKSAGFAEDAFWKLSHDYSVLSYNIASKKYRLRNPCGGAEQEVASNDAHILQWGYVKDTI